MKRKSATPNRARLIQAYILRTLLFGAAGGILGCQFTRPNSLVVPLQYSPTDNVATSFTVSKNPARLYVATITDKRDMQDKIGENEETSSKMIPVMAARSRRRCTCTTRWSINCERVVLRSSIRREKRIEC